MKKVKRILTIVIAIGMISSILTQFIGKSVGASLRVTEGEPVKVGVLLYKFDDAYISLVRQSFEEIQKQNPEKVQFFFFDGKGNQAIQNESLITVLNNKVDLILLNLVDTSITQEAINTIKEFNIPVVLFNREPIVIDAIKSYEKAYFVGTDSKEAGILQGKILVDEWNTNRAIIDRNGDGIMQYIMLKGEKDNPEAIDRTRYSVLTVNNAGIKTQELESVFCGWDKEVAKDITSSLLLRYGDRIEAVISNNDSMAEGAIEALQLIGYNKGDQRKTIPVVGVDAIPSAQELIRAGVMEGSVLQDAKAMAEAVYTIGMNLVYGRKPLEGTNYKFDATGIAVRIPFQEFIINN